MSNGLQFDEEISRKVESLYLTPDVIAQRGQALKALALRKGEQVLDIGSGPGLLIYDIAASVGRDGHVCGIDISEDMLTMSRKRCADQPWTEFRRADATNLPYPDASFDAAVSTQVYEYVVDIPVALAELYRVARRSRGCYRHRLWLASDSHGKQVSHGAGAIGLGRTFRTRWAAPNLVAATARRWFYNPTT